MFIYQRMKCFNSTMVRLKLKMFNKKIRSLKSFNSTMVRLKRTLGDIIKLCFNGFQFHNGSIKTIPPKPPLWIFSLFQFHNGSIKTLKESRLKEGFQFHNGSIKTSIPASKPGLKICFNSTMVRLKLLKKWKNWVQLIRFNSTMVRLKHCWCLKYPLRKIHVSIPQWFD